MRIVSKEIELNFAPMPENTGVLAFFKAKEVYSKVGFGFAPQFGFGIQLRSGI